MSREKGEPGGSGSGTPAICRRAAGGRLRSRSQSCATKKWLPASWRPGVRESDLLDYCRARLSGWQVPKRIFFVEEIPVNERGKISRRELARRFSEGTRDFSVAKIGFLIQP